MGCAVAATGSARIVAATRAFWNFIGTFLTLLGRHGTSPKGLPLSLLFR
jgi:hypothetical protein